MKRILFLSLVLVMVVGIGRAQESFFTRDNHYTVEVGGDWLFAPAKLDAFSESKFSGGVHGEFRYTFRRVPVDMGFYASYNILLRKVFSNGPTYDFKSTNFMITADYNWHLSTVFTAFAGAGVGMARIDASKDIKVVEIDPFGAAYVDNGTSGSFAFMPRAGITVGNLARLTVGYKFQEKANRCAFISLGLTLGFK